MDDLDQTLLPMPSEGPGSMSSWRTQITLAQANLHTIATERNWDANLQAYLGKGDKKRYGKNTTNVRKDFTLAEIKKALLFYQLPDVAATAKKPEYEVAAPLVGAVVNDYLGPDRMNAMAMVDEILMDLLVPSGIGVSKIGYECFVNPQLREVPELNPATGLPAVDDLTGEPIMRPNVVREQYFWNRIPPKTFLFPPKFIGSDFDQASWVGFRYTASKIATARTFELEISQLQTGSIDPGKDLLASDVSRATQESDDTVNLIEIWYRAADVDPLVGDPEIIRQLVLLEGREDAPLVHRLSPYQRLNDNGGLHEGMRGFPIHVFSLRYVSDQAIPQSDCSASREQVDELSKGRTQMIDQRDRGNPLTAYDNTRVPKEAIDKYLKGETQELIGIPGFDAGQPPFAPVNKASWPRENFEFNNVINRDIGETWSLGQNQLGQETDAKRTATELSFMDKGTETRMGKEEARLMRQFAKGCHKALALVQLFADDTDYARVSDPNGQMVLQAWDKTAIVGDYTITLAPDSSKRVDAVSEKKRAIDIFTLFGNDPLTNQVELRKRTWRKLGEDAARLVLEPKPKPPEQPQVSATFKGEDFIPFAPQYQNVATIMSVGGIGLAPPSGPPVDQPDATNPGGVPPVTPLDKRFDTSGESGQLPGGGAAPDAGGVAGR